MATGGQPLEDEVAELAARGFDVVINLGLHDSEYALANEAASVARLGMDYIHIPVRSDAPQAADLQRFVAALAHCHGRRVFIHCAANRRVSVFLALYRILAQSWSVRDALRHVYDIWTPDTVWSRFIDEQLRRDTPCERSASPSHLSSLAASTDTPQR